MTDAKENPMQIYVDRAMAFEVRRLAEQFMIAALQGGVTATWPLAKQCAQLARDMLEATPIHEAPKPA